MRAGCTHANMKEYTGAHRGAPINSVSAHVLAVAAQKVAVKAPPAAAPQPAKPPRLPARYSGPFPNKLPPQCVAATAWTNTAPAQPAVPLADKRPALQPPDDAVVGLNLAQCVAVGNRMNAAILDVQRAATLLHSISSGLQNQLEVIRKGTLRLACGPLAHARR